MAGFVTNQNPLFRILTQDTQAFKGMSASRWRSMKYPQRIKKLQEGFEQYTMSNPQIMESYTKSLTGQLVILQNFLRALPL